MAYRFSADISTRLHVVAQSIPCTMLSGGYQMSSINPRPNHCLNLPMTAH